MKFKPGDRVVCVNASGCYSLQTGQIYTVQDYFSICNKTIELIELGGHYYSELRFELAPTPEEPKPKFKPGDKVICVDNKYLLWNNCQEADPYLVKGKVYVVIDVVGVFVKVSGSPSFPYFASRFELETEKTTCTCNIDDLMIKGCACGAFQREKL